jgi:hypothetical protein
VSHCLRRRDDVQRGRWLPPIAHLMSDLQWKMAGMAPGRSPDARPTNT